MNLFDKIKNDPFIEECYLLADDPNSNDGFWAYHGLAHVNSVVNIIENILLQLAYDEEYIENAKIAALLHDVGYAGVKKDHDLRSCEMAKKYFEDNNIKLKYEAEILDAIKSHRNTFDNDNVMGSVLVLADKLDIKKTRITPEGRKVIGLRQYQYIEDIIIKKEGNTFTVQFIINKKCNKEELEEWYFTAKVFKAMKSFTNHFKLNLKVMWNDEEWILEK